MINMTTHALALDGLDSLGLKLSISLSFKYLSLKSEAKPGFVLNEGNTTHSVLRVPGKFVISTAII